MVKFGGQFYSDFERRKNFLLVTLGRKRQRASTVNRLVCAEAFVESICVNSFSVVFWSEVKPIERWFAKMMAQFMMDLKTGKVARASLCILCLSPFDPVECVLTMCSSPNYRTAPQPIALLARIAQNGRLERATPVDRFRRAGPVQAARLAGRYPQNALARLPLLQRGGRYAAPKQPQLPAAVRSDRFEQPGKHTAAQLQRTGASSSPVAHQITAPVR